MPSKKTAKRKATRQRAKAKGEGNINVVDVTTGPLVPRSNRLSNMISGLPQSITRVLGYVTGSSSTLGTTYTTLATVILNSAFDPDAALGGASSQLYAKYIAMYTKCFVVAARIKVRYCAGHTVNPGNPPQSATVCGLTISTNTTTLGSVIQATQQGLSEFKLLNVNPDSHTFNNSVDVAKFLDKPYVLDDPQLFSTNAANPGQVIVAQFWGQSLSVATSTEITFYIEVEQTCVFTDPNSPVT